MKNKVIVIPIKIVRTQVLVCVGVTKNYLHNWAKRKKITKEAKEIIKQIPDEVFDLKRGGYTFSMVNKERDEKFFIIFLADYKNYWDYAETLLHEIVHLKQSIFEWRDIRDELEFEAYFIETVFNQIRTALEKFLK